MRRVAAAAAVLAAAAALAVALMGAGGSGGTYQVRAIFDNADFVIPGEDVKVAGVKVGKIDSLDVTKDYKAAVVLDITDPGYQDFRQDASCIVRPQGLIGERFVECTLTAKRSPGEQPPPPLKKIDRGPGKGQYLLPVDHTMHTVDLDLIGDIMRQPERQRLSLILNELGTGLAGRGTDLNDVIRRADPALKEVDNLLRILGTQNKVLADLARNSDTVLAPLAAQRVKVADAIANSGAVAEATAERRAALEADIQKLPAFLAQLKPTMTRLGSLSDEMTPVLSDLHAQAPNINRVIEQLGPFSSAALTAIGQPGEPQNAGTLNQVARVGTPAMIEARPVIADLRQTAKALRPVARNAAALLRSFQANHGIERAMDYIYYQVTAINGMDGIGHYLRAGLIVNQCTNYATSTTPGCSANFSGASSASAASAQPVATPVPRTGRQQPAAARVASPADAAPEQTAQQTALMDYLFGSDK